MFYLYGNNDHQLCSSQISDTTCCCHGYASLVTTINKITAEVASNMIGCFDVKFYSHEMRSSLFSNDSQSPDQH